MSADSTALDRACMGAYDLTCGRRSCRVGPAAEPLEADATSVTGGSAHA